MGARKLRQYYKYPEMKKLKGHGEQSNHKGLFTVIAILFAAFLVFSSVKSESKPEQEPEQKETLEGFAKRAIENIPEKQEKVHLGNVSDWQVKAIESIVGINTSEYKWIIDNYGIRHILNKQTHGIKIEMLNKIFSVINSPDNFNKSNQQNKDIYSIEIDKNFPDYKITCIVEIRTKRKEIVIVTTYKNWLK